MRMTRPLANDLTMNWVRRFIVTEKDQTPLIQGCLIRHDGMESGSALAKEMRQSQATQLTAAQSSCTDQHAEGSTLFALVLFPFILLSFVSFREELRYSQAAHLAATQRASTDQHAESSAIIVLLIFPFILLSFVSFTEEMRQSQAAQLTAAQRASTDQHAEHSFFIFPTFFFVIFH